ncbi:RNA recognition motif domain-containing protein [Vibrio sp. VB16]|uniref:RNA recognition motif domain-containing protein n=1 Tax=Vibrio sp. VB16 TaxID=2785746 RepID=UPI0018A1248E|nr:RNA-binding protein [Vibrio sp. VB16]UGA54695.1 RNA-binding protein [Vibrio sp. VB16]
MNSKKFIFLIIALAVLGAAIFSQLAVSPAISFVIGVVASAFILNLSCSTTSSSTTPKDKPSTTTLYVGNLPYKANETNVRQVFSEHGEVFAVRLMKDKRTGKRRGFGFVVVGSSDVDNVISGLNDHDYMQRTLKVRIANDPKHPESESSQ